MSYFESMSGGLAAALIVGWVLCGIAAGHIADEKGYSFIAGCFGGGLLGLLGLLWVGFLPDKKLREELKAMFWSQGGAPRGYVAECPECGGTEDAVAGAELMSTRTRGKGY